ncbi:hypothetical protein T11_9679 [Trichinella zimbabwensis]|uniref:Uncharacterized protein n=1 Tax=Trichinella zimbabwensis TaxID=268475 RepID=A0A0V1HW91_9BILA|nr:hypothetical protein T11_9679 [Trichinella zimbabwensis]
MLTEILLDVNIPTVERLRALNMTYNIDESVISTRPHKFVVVKPLSLLLMNALMQAFNHAVLYFSKAMLMNIPGYKLKTGNSRLVII